MAGLSSLIVIGSINTRHGVEHPQDSPRWTEPDFLLFSLRWTLEEGSPSYIYETTASQVQQMDLLGCRFKVVGIFNSTPRGVAF